jgi:ATP-dependent Clp protease ATP-binding subunit ClpC
LEVPHEFETRVIVTAQHRGLAERAFELEVTAAARQYLLTKGTSSEYGARELKRTILREVTQPLAAMVANAEVPPESTVSIDRTETGLAFRVHD